MHCLYCRQFSLRSTSDRWLYGLALLDPVDFNKTDSIFWLRFWFFYLYFSFPLIDIASN